MATILKTVYHPSPPLQTWAFRPLGGESCR